MAASFTGSHSRSHQALRQSFLYLIMIAISVATVVPFLFMLSTAFAHSTTMMSLPPRFWPKEPTLDNFTEIILNFEGGLFPRWFLNTLFTTAVITVGGLILNTLAGY